VSIQAVGLMASLEVVWRVALRDSCEPAENIGSSADGWMPNSVWKRLRITLASEKSSSDPARWGCVAYALEAESALSEFGVELDVHSPD
jgi:hypothetical protein